MEEFEILLILMVVVWVMGKIFRILTLPVIFGELLGGVIVGPLVLGLINPESHTIKILTELGVFFLMLHAGLETDPRELIKGSKKSILIAILGVLTPFILSFLAAYFFKFSYTETTFIALALSATAIAVSVRVLKDFRLSNSTFGHTILGAAVLSDILILITFSVLIRIVNGESLSPLLFIFIILKIVAFFSVVIVSGFALQKHISGFFNNKGFTLTLIIALCLALIAEWIGLHAIIGAFLAGLFIREEVLDTKKFQKIEDRIYGLSYSFLGPIFFVSLAFHLDFSALSKNLLLFTLLFLTAFLGKFIGSAVAAYIQKNNYCKSITTGLLMNSRGAVDLIIISVGLQSAIINKEIFSVLISIVFATTIISVLALRPLKKLIIRDQC